MNTVDKKTDSFRNLEELKAYKTELRKEVNLQKEKLTVSFDRLVTPLMNTSPLTFLISNVTKGFSIVEGILFGVRTVRRILRFFRR